MTPAEQRIIGDAIAPHLTKISRMFQNPKITLLVRNPDVADGDVLLTTEADIETAIAAIRNVAAKGSKGDAVG